MSLLGLFNISTSTLQNSQVALDVISNNIANANTPGYSKQDVVLEIRNPAQTSFGSIGMGAYVASIERQVDSFVQQQLIGENQNYGAASSRSQSTGQIEQIFNDDNNTGLMTSLTDFFNAWQDVASNPEDLSARTVLLSKADALVSTSQQMERGMLDTVANVNTQVKDLAGKINGIAKDIATLNVKIASVEGGSSAKQANDLRDQRDELLNQLSQIAEISTREDSTGQVTVTMGMRNLVSSGLANALNTSVADNTGTYDITLDDVDITSRITKGQLGGLFIVRDEIKNGPLKDMRSLIGALVKDVNSCQSSGFGLGSQPSDFTVQDQTQQMVPGQAANALALVIKDKDFSNFVPGDYTINFKDQGGSLVYDVSNSSGQVVASAGYVPGTPLVFNGITTGFAHDPVAGEEYHISARGKDFFSAPSVYTENLTGSKANVSSASVFNAANSDIDDYEIRFTGSNTYDIYDVSTGSNIVSGATYATGAHIYFRGLDVVVSGNAVAGDRLLVNTTTNAISSLKRTLTDASDVAAASSSSALPGDNTNATSIAAVLTESLPILGNSSLQDYYKEIVSKAGASSKQASDSQTFEQNVLNQITTMRDSVSGVNLDEEAANMIKYQRSYEAGARMIKVTDELLQTILNL